MKFDVKDSVASLFRKLRRASELPVVLLPDFPTTHEEILHANRLGLVAMLRLYLLGRCSNDAVVDGKYEIESRAAGTRRRFNYCDSGVGIRELEATVEMGFEDPFKSFTINQGHAPSREEIDFVRRLILFLESDTEYRIPNTEYRWAAYSRGCGLIVADILTLGLTRLIWPHKKPVKGDEDVWPFFTQAEFEAIAQSAPIPPTVVDEPAPGMK